jgi:hypothetical protein
MSHMSPQKLQPRLERVAGLLPEVLEHVGARRLSAHHEMTEDAGGIKMTNQTGRSRASAAAGRLGTPRRRVGGSSDGTEGAPESCIPPRRFIDGLTDLSAARHE